MLPDLHSRQLVRSKFSNIRQLRLLFKEMSVLALTALHCFPWSSLTELPATLFPVLTELDLLLGPLTLKRSYNNSGSRFRKRPAETVYPVGQLLSLSSRHYARGNVQRRAGYACMAAPFSQDKQGWLCSGGPKKWHTAWSAVCVFSRACTRSIWQAVHSTSDTGMQNSRFSARWSTALV